MKVVIVGAGPGDPELITVKGQKLIAAADIIIYAGSLVNPALLDYAQPSVPRFNSASMTLEEVLAIFDAHASENGLIVRLHTGDPSMYGAIQEQIDHCEKSGIEVEVVPGVSSVFAAAASIRREFTLPGVSQTLILTRAAGRTPVPERESIKALAEHGASMAIFLSATLFSDLITDLLPSYGAECPIRLVHRASWPDEETLSSTLGAVEEAVAESAIFKSVQGQLMILVGSALGTGCLNYDRSKLYDPSFSHGLRKSAPS